MSMIPRAVAEWMISSLPSDNIRRNNYDHTVNQLVETVTGLGILTVKELKILGKRLYSMAPVVEEASIKYRRLPASANKQRRVEFLRRGLYRDDACQVINDRLVQQMRSETTKTPSSSTTTAAAATSAAVANGGATNNNTIESRKRPSNQISQQNRPQHQQQNRLSANDVSVFLDAYMSQFNPPVATHHRPNPNPALHFWQDMPIPAAQDPFGAANGRQPGEASAEAGSSSAAAASDPHSTPQNATEAILLPQLLQMGFPKQEILDGIRQCQATNSAARPTADEVMLHLVSQREEAEEARKEDEVRLRSEAQKQEESRRREQNQQESLQGATTGDDLKAIFPESWVLNAMLGKPVATILGSTARDDFLEFLKLEEKSRKWYGWKLPSAYFRKVGEHLKSDADKEAATYIKSERERLRSGLYELKEQVNCEPKIFLDERPKETGGPAEIVIIDDD